MRSNVSVRVQLSIPLDIFVLAQYFYHLTTSAIKTCIRPAWVCMSIQLHISLIDSGR